jgi:hypothetical protein
MDVPGMSPARKGKGEGEEKGKGEETSLNLEAHTHLDIGAQAAERVRLCALMEKAGCKNTNPNHPRLLAAIVAGVTPEALLDTAREGIKRERNDPFAWACATALGRQIGTSGPARSKPKDKSPDELQREREERARRNARRHATLPQDVIDLAKRFGIAPAHSDNG